MPLDELAPGIDGVAHEDGEDLVRLDGVLERRRDVLDRQIIDGFLHAVASVVPAVGTFLRQYIDNRIVNGFGDFVGSGTNRVGRELKVVQTGKIQQYMLIAMLFVLTSLLYFLVFAR